MLSRLTDLLQYVHSPPPFSHTLRLLFPSIPNQPHPQNRSQPPNTPPKPPSSPAKPPAPPKALPNSTSSPPTTAATPSPSAGTCAWTPRRLRASTLCLCKRGLFSSKRRTRSLTIWCFWGTWGVRLLGARVGWGRVRGLVRSEVRDWKGDGVGGWRL